MRVHMCKDYQSSALLLAGTLSHLASSLCQLSNAVAIQTVENLIISPFHISNQLPKIVDSLLS